jgi:hypothetical protein
MILEVLYRARVAPVEHLGSRSLLRLEAFHRGYGLFPFRRAKDFSSDAVRDWILAAYRPRFHTTTMGAMWIIRELAPDDEGAFDLFFQALDSVIAADPAFLTKPLDRSFLTNEPPLPVSSFLVALSERPAMFLPLTSVSCLRAFLDGYCLAAMEEGHFECLDLDGFEHWIRRKLDLLGMFRWENVVSVHFRGLEADAFRWTIEELKSFRASKGELTDRTYQIHVISESP